VTKRTTDMTPAEDERYRKRDVRTPTTGRMSDRHRDAIQVGRLLERLQKVAHGEIQMTQTALKAAEILLRKSLPDLSSVELTGADGGAIQVVSEVAPTLSIEQWVLLAHGQPVELKAIQRSPSIPADAA
jgi:hypothetical protein